MQASMRTVFKTLGAVDALQRQWWRTKAWITWMISPMTEIGQRPLMELMNSSTSIIRQWWRTKALIPWMISPIGEVGQMLNPGVQPRDGNPEVTGIPQVDYSTSQRQLTSAQAEVAYLITYPITTKPVVRTN